jgi:hypothetical protein
MAGESEIDHLNRCRVAASARCTGRHHRDIPILALGQEKCLERRAVNRIQHGIEAGIKNFVSIGFEEECLKRTNVTVGIDGLNSARHDLDFGFAKLPIHCVELAIDVADADIVQVHEGYAA